MTKPELDRLETEARNAATTDFDAMDTAALLAAMNAEDQQVARAVQRALPQLACAVDAIAARMLRGGRLVYCGAGTSGRLGVLDAAECEPTFSSAPGQVVGLIAGGSAALSAAVEGAEDDPQRGAADLQALQPRADDSVVGITASGRTPYVLGALAAARAAGAFTAAVVCTSGSPVAAAAEVAIEVVTGAEVLTGSTRLKAGTAQKMVLNMLSTAAFVRLHKVYGNLMVDVQATNDKLRERAVRIVMTATGAERDAATAALQRCAGQVKTAILALCAHLDAEAARARLAAHGGSVRRALEQS